MLSNFGWRSLEYHRYDSCLVMFYKIQYGLVAVSMPPYFERPTRITGYMHSLSFRQVHVSADYYSVDCCFVEQVPRRFIRLRSFDSFKREVSTINYPGP